MSSRDSRVLSWGGLLWLGALATACFTPDSSQLIDDDEETEAPTSTSTNNGTTSSDSVTSTTAATATVTMSSTDTTPTQTATMSSTDTITDSSSSSSTTTGDDPDSSSSSTTSVAPSCTVTNGEGQNFECSTFAQDCPDDQRCVTFGSNFIVEGTRCDPEPMMPASLGDPCVSAGSHAGNCEQGAFCFNDMCITMCGCENDEASCENPQDYCTGILNPDSVPSCIANCDPLLQDCPFADDACYFLGDFAEVGGPPFRCAGDASGDELGAFGDPCEFINACDPGLVCVPAAVFPSCVSTGCCTNFCDLGNPLPTCAGGTQCVPLFAEGEAPMGHENVGWCIDP